SRQDRDLCFRPISTWRSRHTAHTGVRPKREWVTRPSGPARHDDPPRIRVWTMDAQEWPQGHKRSKSSSEKREAEKDRKLSTKLPGHVSLCLCRLCPFHDARVGVSPGLSVLFSLLCLSAYTYVRFVACLSICVLYRNPSCSFLCIHRKC
uniref:Ovule protein n=1 Tax=Haemonchus contortus TaxID=6289 RepID=A0A7I5EA16_HAECO